MVAWRARLAHAKPVLLVLLVLLFLGGLALVSWRPGLPGRPERADTEKAALTQPGATADPYLGTRRTMVERDIRGRGVADEAVLEVMARVPRHAFVLPEYLASAYADHPLPIGYGQTISQPYIVAAMTELLRVKPDSTVLEIGTGSAYQAAILAELARQVYTIEIVEELCVQARSRLADMGYRNVQVICGDGYYGWEKAAPYDAIIVTCAPDHVPQPLVNQLADGGRMVIPVGPPGMYQVLWVIERHGEEIKSEQVMGVAFVPLTRGEGP
jgi:protein-L-isoaspartate(D-aspartate) O-methyltransferase